MRSYTHVSVEDSSLSPTGSSSAEADADTQLDAPSLAQLLEADCQNSSLSLVDTSLLCGLQLETPLIHLRARLLEEDTLTQVLSQQRHTAAVEHPRTSNLEHHHIPSGHHPAAHKSPSSQAHPQSFTPASPMVGSSLPSPLASGTVLQWGGPGPQWAGANVGPHSTQLPLRLDQGCSLLQNMFLSTLPAPVEHAPRQSSSVKIEDIGPIEPASALNSPLTVLSPGEERRLQELESARTQLGKILQAVQDDATVKWKPKFDEMLQQIKRLVDELGAEVEQHQLLQSRHRHVSMQLASADRELHWMQMAPLAGQAGPPALAADACAAAPLGALVSVLQLPPAAEWDAAWDERVRRLQTLELLHLHRQWLQHSAMLLPKVQMLRGTPVGLEVAQQLEELYVRYDCFSQRVMRLAPGPWSEFALYSLDTMQQLQRPPRPAEVRELMLAYAPESTSKLLPIQVHYAGVFARLQEQCTPLQEHYEQLQLAAGAGSSRMHSSGWEVEVDETLRLLQANLLQQQLERAAFVHALNFALPVEAMLQLKLLLYPLAENGQVVTHKEYVQ